LEKNTSGENVVPMFLFGWLHYKLMIGQLGLLNYESDDGPLNVNCLQQSKTDKQTDGRTNE